MYYGFKPAPAIIKNPKAKSILERVHQVLVYLLRLKNLQKYDQIQKTERLYDASQMKETLSVACCAVLGSIAN